jgi:hypothetical protein
MTPAERDAQNLRECDDAYHKILGRHLVSDQRDYLEIAEAILQRHTMSPEEFEALLRAQQPAWTRPTREVTLASMRGDLCHRATTGDGHSYIAGTGQWCYLGLDDATWAREVAYHRAHNEPFFVGAARVDYLQERGEIPFDLTRDPGLFRARLERAYTDGMIPFVDLQLYDDGHGAETIAVWERLLPELRDHLCGVVTALELDVAGGPSAYTPEEHEHLIRMFRDACGEQLVVMVSFNVKSDEVTEPVIYDGRCAASAEDWWLRGIGQVVDVLGLRMPYCLTTDRHTFAEELSGAIYRLQEAFPIPEAWADGTPLSDEAQANLRNHFASKLVIPLEYGSSIEMASADKRALRVFAQNSLLRADGSSVVTGFNEG